LQHLKDRFDNAFGVRQHVVVPKADDAPTLPLQEGCATLIRFIV
jgi:hypothetical protein